MPTSKLELIQPIIHIIWQYREGIGRPIRVLDVGPGWGKYGLLIREAADPDAIIDAIEPHPVWPALNGIYRQIWSDDARFMPSGQQDDDDEWRGFASYDLILLIDVIEHMPVADGRALLSLIRAPILISTPGRVFATPEEAPELPEWEQHHSVWTYRMIEEAVAPRQVDAYGGFWVEAIEQLVVTVEA
jgi:2-polyprenyl-3-methyl-5-hydroxy-6-metoxy-1,4-benzoquinol methylase